MPQRYSPLTPEWARKYGRELTPVDYPKHVLRGQAQAQQQPARPVSGSRDGRNPNYLGGNGRCREGFKLPTVGMNIQRVRQYPSQRK